MASKKETETVEPKAIAGLTEGRMVHFIDSDSNEHRPAIIVKVHDHGTGRVNLQVFNTAPEQGSGSVWAVDAMFSEEGKKRGTWHWIEKA